MGRFYIRFFQHGVEVDWSRFDDDDVDYFLDNVLDMCGPTYHSEAYFDTFMDGDDMCLGYYLRERQVALPKELLEKTMEFGWGKDRKELRLIGDRIPIDEDVKFQITYC